MTFDSGGMVVVADALKGKKTAKSIRKKGDRGNFFICLIRGKSSRIVKLCNTIAQNTQGNHCTLCAFRNSPELPASIRPSKIRA